MRATRCGRPGLLTMTGVMLALGLLLIAPAHSVSAATFTVNSTLDEPDASPGDGQCASTPSGACTLRAAVMEANAQGGAQTISLPAGTFKLTIPGINENASATGDLDVFVPLTISGASAATTIIDGNLLDNIFDVRAKVTLTIQGVTLQRAATDGIVSLTGNTVTLTNSVIQQNGGVGLSLIRGLAGSVATISGSTVTGNTREAITADTVTLTGSTVSDSGGGNVFGTVRGTIITATNSTVRDNRSTGLYGTLVTVTGSTISGNTTRGGDPLGGVGLSVGAAGIVGAIVNVDRSIVSNNVSQGGNGGGIYGLDFFTSSGVPFQQPTIAVTDSTVIGNTTMNGSGGGIYGGKFVVITRSTISGNTANNFDSGGVHSEARATIDSSTISGNTVNNGNGGGFAGQNTILSNSTVSGNKATGDGLGTGLGGGVYFTAPDTGNLSWNQVTIANNTAPKGGGLYRVSGAIAIANTIIAKNNGSPDCFRITPITSLGHNIDGGAGCGFTNASDKANTDPRLGPLTNNGGPTQTMALLSGSPAIDAGDPADCPATDQRGVTRPQDGDGSPPATCDIGAFEAPANTSPPPSSCTPRPPVAVTSVPDGAGRLRVTVSTSGGAIGVLHFGAATNAQITAPGGSPNAASNFDVTPPPGATSFTFTVARATAGHGVQVPFTVVDACGAWPTFVGGGPTAF
jgi:CSLREA domain-containing protein